MFAYLLRRVIYAVPISHGRLADFLNSVPEVSTWLIMVVNAVLLLLGHLVFRQTGLLFDVAALVLGLSSILVSLIGSLLIWLSLAAGGDKISHYNLINVYKNRGF